MTHLLQSHSEGRWQDTGFALRALEHYLQRTAIQGPPGLLSKLSLLLEET